LQGAIRDENGRELNGFVRFRRGVTDIQQLDTLLLVFERLKLQVETGWALEFDRDSGRRARDCYARRLSAGIRLISDCGQGIAKGGRMCRPVRRSWIDRNVNLSGVGTIVLRTRRVGDEQMLAISRRRHRS